MSVRVLITACCACIAATAAAAFFAQDKPPTVTWPAVLDQPAAWYGTPAARAVADNVLRYQRPDGGWPKNIDMTAPPESTAAGGVKSTIDNGATTTQLRLLARVFRAT